MSHWQSPYVPIDVSAVFGASIFPSPVPGIGYLPPWGLMLAISYLLSYNLLHNLILYNLAAKIPIIIANILLALLIGKVVLSETSDSQLSRYATQFMLFNPYVIYTTAVWGQFDTASVLLMLFAIYALSRSRVYSSAMALGASIAVKLIPIVLLPLLVFYVRKREGWSRALTYCILASMVVMVSLVPFLLGWSLTPIIDNWNIHFVRVGAFSPMNVLLLLGMGSSTNALGFLGYLWIPLLLMAYYLLLRRPIMTSTDLTLSTLALLLVFSLTRAWVSEQNLNFVLPLVLMAAIGLRWPRRWITATWLLPTIFGLLHTSPLLMLFLVVPESTIQTAHAQLQLVVHAISLDQFGLEIISLAQALITVIWLIVGAMLLRKCVREVGMEHSTKTSPGSSSEMKS